MKKVVILLIVLVLAAVVVAVGYFFFGWFGGGSGDGDTAETFTIFYFDEATDTEESFEVTQGQLYSLSPLPTMVGYKFAGLFDDKDKQFVDAYGQSIEPFYGNENLSLKIKWERFLVTVKYDVGGATIQNPADLKEATFEFNGNITAVPTPLRTGWIFLGWFSNANGSEFVQYSDNLGMLADKAELNVENYPSLNKSKEVTLFARFERIYYDVQIYHDNNLGKELGTFKVAHGDTISAYVKNLPTAERVSRGVANRLDFYSEQGSATEFTSPVVKDTVLIGNWSALSGYDDYIVTKDDFFRIVQNPSDSYLLLNDLNLGTWNTPFDFRGTFDGGFNKITYTASIPNTSVYKIGGLFGTLYGARVSNLHINVAMTRAAEYSYGKGAGGLAAFATDVQISRVSVEGRIDYTGSDAFVGGIVGSFSGGTIDQCKNSATIMGHGVVARVGGIVGNIINQVSVCTISNSYNTGSITTWCDYIFNNKFGGGIVGFIEGGSYAVRITNCYNASSVTAKGGAAWGTTQAAISGGNSRLTCESCYFDSALAQFAVVDAPSYTGCTGRMSYGMLGFPSASQYYGWSNEIWRFSEDDMPRLRAIE